MRRGSFFHRSWLSEGVNGTRFAFGIGEAVIEGDGSSLLKFKRGIVLDTETKRQALQGPRNVPVKWRRELVPDSIPIRLIPQKTINLIQTKNKKIKTEGLESDLDGVAGG